MSVFIKGMDMPKRGCDHCFLRTGNYCSRLTESVVEYAVKEERHPNCPLVEVPKHGRLIDATIVEESAREYVKKYDERSAKNRHPCREVIDYGRFLDMKWSARADGAEAVADMIANAPTVIEAEE